MARAQSLRRELDIDGSIIYPIEIDEFAPGGLDVMGDAQDGTIEYKFRTGQKQMGEVGVVVNKKTDMAEFDIMMNFANDNKVRDITVIGRDANGTAVETHLFSECDCAVGMGSSFDRSGTDPDTQRFVLLPQTIEEIR